MPEIIVYDSLLEVPLETHSGDLDGDDSIIPNFQPYTPPAVPQALLLPAVQTLVVPYLGPLKPGMRSQAVQAMARGLSQAGYLQWLKPNLTGYFGPRKAKALIAFKKAHGLPADPIYGVGAHKALARYYDAYAIHYLLRGSLDDRARELFLAQAYYLYNRRWSLAYTQQRPYDRSRTPWGEDCSSLGEWSAEWAGEPSLSGLPRGYGNTYSQLAHFRALGRVRASILQAKIGDPRYYGAPSHVAYWLGLDAQGTFRVISNGAHPMMVLSYDYRPDGNWICDLTGA